MNTAYSAGTGINPRKMNRAMNALRLPIIGDLINLLNSRKGLPKRMGDYYDKKMLDELRETNFHLKQMSKDIHVLTQLLAEDIHVLTQLLAEDVKKKEKIKNGESRDFGDGQSGDYIYEIDDGN